MLIVVNAVVTPMLDLEVPFTEMMASNTYMWRLSLAVAAPEALQAIEDAEGMNLYDAEAIIVLVTFAFGWITFAVSMIRANVFSLLAPILVIAGFFATPLLTAVTSVKLGGALGNAVMGSGFILLGRELLRK